MSKNVDNAKVENQITEIVNTSEYREKERSLAEQFGSANTDIFTSIHNDGSVESKAKVYNAMNNTDFSIGDYIGETIEMVDFLAHRGSITDDETGEVSEIDRCVIIDVNGKTYGSISTGIKNSMLNIFQSFGNPQTWENPLPLQVVEKKSKRGRRFYSIKVV